DEEPDEYAESEETESGGQQGCGVRNCLQPDGGGAVGYRRDGQAPIRLLLPVATRMSGWIYLVTAVILGSIFIGYAVALKRRYSDRLSRQTFRYSIAYLAGLFSALLFDHYWQ